MTRKLFALAIGECMEDNPDSLVNQEVLTPGQLFLMFLKVNACGFHPGPVVYLVESCDSVLQYYFLHVHNP